MLTMKLLLPALLLASLPPVHDCAKILYLPFPLPSSVGMGTWLEEELHNLGHELWIAHPSTHAPPSFNTSRSIIYTSLDEEDLERTITSKQIHHFLHNEDYVQSRPDDYAGILANIQDALHELMFPDKVPRFVQDTVKAVQDTLRADKDLLDRVIKEKFNLVLVDHDLNYQNVLARNGQEFIYISEYPDELMAGVPVHPGLTPVPGSHFSEQMTLPQRVHNTLLYIARVASSSLTLHLEPSEDLRNSQRRKLWIAVQDSLIDYPRPSMPNVKYIGGVSLGKPRNLSKKIKTFYEKSTDVVVVSFGENIVDLGLQYTEKLFQSFASTKYSFIVRLNTTSPNPKRFLIVSDTVQIDLLAQSKTRLFVSSCDINSQYEALSQGVPVLCIPLTRSLHNNALRLEEKGYGTYILLHDSTVDNITNAINSMFERQEFQENVARAAKLLNAKPMTGRQEAAFWIDHVIQYGDTHFRSAHLEWYSHLCLDISLVYVSFVCFLVYFLNGFVKWSLPGFFRESDIRKEKSE